MQNLILYKSGQASFVRWIKKRIENNLNFLALASGPTGVGKSWSMLSVAKMIDPDFKIEQCCFSFKEIMQLINNEEFMKRKWRIILFDEAQTDISNREWQSLTNKLMNYLLSTFRHKNIILLFTSPYSDFLDSASMKLIHTTFDIRSHSRKDNQTLIRPKILQYNSERKKFYYHSLHVIRDKKVQKMTFWKVPKPPKDLIKEYEAKKTAFTNKLNKEILEQLESYDKKKEEKKLLPRLTDQQKLILDTYLELRKQTLVAERLNMCNSLVSTQLKSIRKKGYSLDKE